MILINYVLQISLINPCVNLGSGKLSVVWKYENNEAIPSAEVIKRVAQVFNVSADYLLFDESEKENITKISDKQLLRQFEEIDKMDESDKTHIRPKTSVIFQKQKKTFND